MTALNNDIPDMINSVEAFNREYFCQRERFGKLQVHMSELVKKMSYDFNWVRQIPLSEANELG